MGFDCLPAKKIKLRADFNEFHLATVLGLTVQLEFGAGYGHLFAGDYLKQSKASFGYT